MESQILKDLGQLICLYDKKRCSASQVYETEDDVLK